MDFKDYYKILGVDSDADLKTIKSAYRRLARKYHPDVSTESGAENKFKEIAEAYAVLKDQSKRAEYDVLCEQVRSGQYKSSFQQSNTRTSEDYHHDFSDFFESIFRQTQSSGKYDDIYRQHPGFKGQDVEMILNISLEEGLLGGSKTISFQLPSETKVKKLKVSIPPETLLGDVIRLKGQGLPGDKNHPAGDIYLKIDYEPHAYFDVEGLDLILTVPIMPWEAALGASIVIPTLTSKLSLTIPPNTQTGKKLRIKGKGLKSKKRTGDLFAIVKVVMPSKSDAEMNTLWERMAEKFDDNPRSKWS